MIRLRALGDVGLTDADGHDIAAVLQQPKRFALLTYLAVGMDRWHRRDTLVTLFWGDMDDARARASLRRTLTFLRTHLGDATLRTRGDEVAVTPDTLWCDVAACERALADGRPAEAVAMYRGDLLQGLHVPTASGFEEWADAERARLQRLVGDAAAGLAAEAEGDGHHADAVAWCRRTLALRPDDERTVRTLLTLLDRLGDRTGALRAYDEFAQRLDRDLGLEPHAETRQIVDAIRTRPAALPVPAERGLRDPDPHVLAVFPFPVHGPADLHYLRDGIVDLLSTKLDGAGDVRTVDPGRVLTVAGAWPPGPVDAAVVRSAAVALGAGAYLVGSVVADGDRTMIRATLHSTDLATERRVDVETGSATSVFTLVDDLVRQLLAHRTESLGGQLARLGATTTESLPALRAYLDGERAFRLGCVHQARAAYDEATGLDPEFALAHYRLASSHLACDAVPPALDALQLASRGAGKLSTHVRMLLAAQGALLNGSLREAERLCLRLLGDRPDDVEAWYRLARIQLDGNRFRGRPEAEARAALERTCELDPRHAAALADLARLSWSLGDRESARRCAIRYLALSPAGDDAAVMAALTSETGTEGYRSSLRPAVLRQLVALEQRGVSLGGDAAAAVAGPWSSILSAYASAAAGRWDDADAAFTRAAQLDPAMALDHHAFLAACDPAAPHLAGLVERVEATVHDREPPSGLTQAGLLRPALRLHSLGRLQVRMGALDAATATAAACAAVALPAWAATLPMTLAAGIEAHVALAGGNPEAAIGHLERIDLGPWMHVAGESPQCGLVAERRLRAAALGALGRHDEARAWQTPPATLRPLEWVAERLLNEAR